MQSLRSKANIEKKRQKRKKAFVILLAILVFLFALFSYYAYADRFHIKNIIVSGSSFAKKEDIHAAVSAILEEKLWGIFPRKSSFLIGKKYIVHMLGEKFPPINVADVDIRNNELFVDIEERTATAVICATNCYFLDKNGFAFASAPQFEGSSFIKIKTYDTAVQAGVSAIEKDEFDKLVKEVELFKSLNLPIQHISLTSRSEMRLVDGNNTEFIINRRDSAEIIEERLRTIVTSRSDIASGTYEYVDLRIDSKIFLKNRES